MLNAVPYRLFLYVGDQYHCAKIVDIWKILCTSEAFPLVCLQFACTCISIVKLLTGTALHPLNTFKSSWRDILLPLPLPSQRLTICYAHLEAFPQPLDAVCPVAGVQVLHLDRVPHQSHLHLTGHSEATGKFTGHSILARSGQLVRGPEK